MVHWAKEAGEHYKFKVPLDADYKIGRSWAGEPLDAPTKIIEEFLPLQPARGACASEAAMSEEQTPDDLTIPDFLLRITGDQDTVPEPLGLQSTIPALPAAVAPTIVPELGVPELHEIAPANEVCTWVHCIQCGDRLYLRGSIADAEDGDNCYCKDCKPDPVPKQLNLAALLHDDVKLGRDWRAGDIRARRIAGASPELGTPVLREIIYPGAANRFAALAYAVGNNWPVFPVPPGTRKSYRAGADNGPRWDSTLDPEKIERDWKKWPAAGVGITTGAEAGIFVVDVDTPTGHHGVDGVAALAALEARHSALPPTLTVTTPSGGTHLYFVHPGNGTKIKNSTSAIALGVDVCGDGAMVMAPPSVRPGVGAYRWANALPIAVAPEWLLELVQEQPHEPSSAEPQAAIERVAEALAVIPNKEGWDDWNHIGMATWRASGGSEEGFTLWERWSAKSTKHDPGNTRERWQHFFDSPPTQVGAGTLFWRAHAAVGGRYNDLGTDDEPDTANTSTSSPRPPLPFLDMSRWDDEPEPPREWAVPDRFPLYQTSLLSGEGAVGKSILDMQLTFAHVLGREWLDVIPIPGPALFIDAEDDGDELHRRAAKIVAYYDTTFTNAIRSGLHLMSLAGHDAVLATATHNGKIEPTVLYKQLLEAAGDLKPKLIGIASSANVFAGSENDRTQVQQFISLMTRIAMTAGGAVQLITHPSFTGINTDTGLSGNTAWHNSVRARAYLKGVKPEAGEQPDSDLRELTFKKNNYGPVTASLVLRYQNGLFLPAAGISSLDQQAREETARDVFLKLLKRFNATNRRVSSQPCVTYAPTLFAREDEAKRAGLTNKALEIAMRQLFRDDTIWNEPHGRASHERFHIAIKE